MYRSHSLLLAGLAAYWGGDNANFGKPLIYHIKRINDYLNEHRDIDLNNPAEFYSLDSYTNPQYVLGAIICDEALRKGGIEKLKKLLNGGTLDETLTKTIQTELSVPPDKLNSFLQNRIAEAARKQSFEPVHLKAR